MLEQISMASLIDKPEEYLKEALTGGSQLFKSLATLHYNFCHSGSNVRNLKVYARYQPHKWGEGTYVPEIILHCHWLRQSGFETGEQISVITLPEVLIITKRLLSA